MNKTAPKKKRVRPVLVLAAVLAVGLVVRVAFLAELEKSGFSDLLPLDSRLYRDVAHNIIAEGKFPEGGLTFNPLYPAVLVAIFRLFGEGLLAPRVLQFAIGLLTIVLIYLAGRRLAEGPTKRWKPGGTGTAIAAAVMAVLYSRFVLYEGMLLATTLEIFLYTAAFVVALALDADLRGERPLKIKSRRVPLWFSSLLLGALCGAGALGRPNLFLLLIPALMIWLVVRSRRERKGLIPAVSLIIGVAVFLIPPTVFNAVGTGRLVPVGAHGGLNFYIGNDPKNGGIFQAPEGMRGTVPELVEDSRAIAEAETGRRMTHAEASDYYLHKTLDKIKLDPSAWLRVMGRKFVLFFNFGIPDMPNVYFYERSCGILKFLFVPFALIASLSVSGLIVLFRSGRNRFVVSLFLVCAVLSVVFVFANERYRLPAIPLLILLAAYFLGWAAREISRKRVELVAILAALAVVFFFLVSHRTMVEMSHSAAYAYLGNYYLEKGDESAAAESLAEAFRRDPNMVDAITNYARILSRQRKTVESAEMYARAYARAPRYPFLAVEYGLALAVLGRTEEAKQLYLQAATSNQARERLYACGILGEQAMIEGKRDEAILWLKRGLEIAPGDARLTEMLKAIEGQQ